MATTSTYAAVRGLSRGLTVLMAMNRMHSGRATAQQLSIATGLHRTTVRRLLETLLAEGLVRRSESDDHYMLTLKVRSLSDGFTDDQWVSAVAAPLMGELFQQVVWPSDLVTAEGADVVIRESTHRFSPLSFHRAMVGRRLPMLLTAAGRAYFCACSDAQQEQILSILRTGGGCTEQAAFANDTAYLRNLIRQVSEDGYAINRSDWAEQQKIGAMAVALRSNGRAVGALNVIYLSRAFTAEQAEQRFLEPMRRIAARIEEGMGTAHNA